MLDETPKKGTPKRASTGFSPVILPKTPANSTPNRSLTGTPRLVKDLIADIYNNIQKWNDFHIEGANIVKQIGTLKTNNLDSFSTELEELTNSLFNIVKQLKLRQDRFNTFKNQINALVKLDKDSQPIFLSHNLVSLASLVESVINAYEAEFNIKEFVLESIAHSRSKEEVMFHAACWTYQINITRDIKLKMEILLVESGHRKIT